MNFFKWLRWIFSKRIRIEVIDLNFENVHDSSCFKKNGVFYENNVRFSAKNCTFTEYTEPEPNVVDLKVELNPTNQEIFIIPDANPEDYTEYKIIPSDLPFKVVSVPSEIISEDNREERFLDAISDWVKKH